MHTKFERLLSKSLTTLEVVMYYLVVHTGPGQEPSTCSWVTKWYKALSWHAFQTTRYKTLCWHVFQATRVGQRGDVKLCAEFCFRLQELDKEVIWNSMLTCLSGYKSWTKKWYKTLCWVLYQTTRVGQRSDIKLYADMSFRLQELDKEVI